jgi:hypothetical protein
MHIPPTEYNRHEQNQSVKRQGGRGLEDRAIMREYLDLYTSASEVCKHPAWSLRGCADDDDDDERMLSIASYGRILLAVLCMHVDVYVTD